MIKRIFSVVVFLAALLISALFTWLNPGEIQLDLGFAAFHTPLGLAFVLAIALGWLLGLLSAVWWITRIAADRRRLKADLRSARASGLAVRDERG
jgi:uncharacterized integral membrane protein